MTPLQEATLAIDRAVIRGDVAALRLALKKLDGKVPPFLIDELFDRACRKDSELYAAVLREEPAPTAQQRCSLEWKAQWDYQDL